MAESEPPTSMREQPNAGNAPSAPPASMSRPSEAPRITRLTDPQVLRMIAGNTVDHGLSGAASAMAFDLFLGIIPLLAMMGWIAGRLARSGKMIGFDLRILDLAPRPAAELAKSHLGGGDHQITTVAPLVILGFLWLSSSGMHVALATVRSIVGLPARPYARTRVIAVGLTLAGVLIAALASAAAGLIHVLGAIGVLSENEHLLWKAVLLTTTIVAATMGNAALYRFAAGRMWQRRSIVPGAFLASLALHAVSWAFSTYVQTLAKYTAFYGGLAAVAVLLVWLWLTSLAVLIGAEANAVLDEQRGRTPKRREPSGSTRL